MGCSGSKEERLERKQQRTMRKYSQRVATSVVSTAITDALSEVAAARSQPAEEDIRDREAGKEESDEQAKSQRRFRRTFSKTSKGSKATPAEAGDGDDEENWIYLTDDDDKRIRAVHKDNPNFSRYELQRVFAAVKENGGSLGRDEFAMVFVTYSKMHDHSMALGVFDLLDVNGDNEVSFEEFIPFLEAMVHGSREDKAKFCFQLYDHENKGEITREDFVTFLSKLPVDHIMGDFELTRPGSRVFSEQKSLPSLCEEEDETEDGERVAEETRKRQRAAEEKKAEDERVRAAMIKSFRKSRGDLPTDTPSHHKDPKVAANLKKAEEIAAKIFEELGTSRSTITLQEFVTRINTSTTLQAFFPF